MNMDNDNQKYQCGCGKAYASYPAYSTHKRTKHHRQSVSGTHLPKQYVPKRGRPSFSLPNQPLAMDYSYSALTTVEIALLRLENTYGKILTEPEMEADLNILDDYLSCSKLIRCPTGENLTRAVKNFNQVIVNHASESISIPLSQFLLEMTLFLLESIKQQPEQGQWGNQSEKVQRVEVALFNRFFASKGRKERVAELAKMTGKPLKFMLDITVVLSEYLCKLNLLDSVLSLKK